MPKFTAVAGAELDLAHTGGCGCFVTDGCGYIAEQFVTGALFTVVGTGIDMANAASGWQANIPYLSGTLCGRQCTGFNWIAVVIIGNLCGQGSVVKQDVILVAHRNTIVLSEK